MSRFLSPYLTQFPPYTPGLQPKEGEFIKLNTNESPFPPPKAVTKAVATASSSLQRYNDTACTKLTEAFARYHGISQDSVLFANGSDEILAFCYLAFCKEAGVVFPAISYGFYPVFAQLFQVKAETIPLGEDLSLCPKDYHRAGATVLIANPNAPTGRGLTLSEIEGIVAENPDNVVIMDEAYVDFGGESAISLVKRYENLLVCGTFSKSRNLAGARLGFAVAQPHLIADLNQVKYSFNPYNVNAMTQAAGIASLEQEDYFQQCRGNIMETRGYFVEKLTRLGFETLPSQANFVFTKHPILSGVQLYERLKERGVLVRHFDKEPIADYLRITIGTQAQMEQVVDVLNTFLGALPPNPRNFLKKIE